MTLSQENLNLWKQSTDIDWMMNFATCRFTFNARYRHHFPTLDNDRAIISEIKNSGNSVYTKIYQLIADGSFCQYISDLHTSLENNLLANQGERITFTNVYISKNIINQEQFTHGGFEFYVKCEHRNTICTLKNTSSTTIFNYSNQTYDIDHFQLALNNSIKHINDEKKRRLEGAFKKVNPKVFENIIQQGLQIGSIQMMDDKEKIVKSIIEILYHLRCILFHGEIVPTKDNQKIYQPAYHILKMIIDGL